MTVTTNNPTLRDFADALNPDGTISATVEILNQVNDIMSHMTFTEGNLTTGHMSNIRTGIPKPTWRRLYKGVVPTKSTTANVTDTVGMMEAYNDLDEEIVELNGNSNAFRMSQAKATIEGMSQDFVTTLLYGNTAVDPEKFDGFECRYNDLNAVNADNIVDAKGVGANNATIWLVMWHPNAVFGILPKGSTAGLTVKDKGHQTLYDEANNPYEGYRMHFKMKGGLCLADWRYVVRICNIDRAALRADPADGGPNLPSLLFEALERLGPSMADARAYGYMDRTIRSMLRQQLAASTKNSTLTYTNVGGHRVAEWNDILLSRVDQLAVDEARVIGL